MALRTHHISVQAPAREIGGQPEKLARIPKFRQRLGWNQGGGTIALTPLRPPSKNKILGHSAPAPIFVAYFCQRKVILL